MDYEDARPSKVSVWASSVALLAVVALCAVWIGVATTHRAADALPRQSSAVSVFGRPQSLACEVSPTLMIPNARKIGHTAYESTPVNIVRSGDYVIQFGPLTPADARTLEGPTSLAMTWPLHDLHDQDLPIEQQINWLRLEPQYQTTTPIPPKPIRVGGASYVRIEFQARVVRYGCVPFRGWLEVP